MEEYKLTREQKSLIKNDTANKKVWDEAMQSLSLGPVRMAAYLHIRVTFRNVLTRFCFSRNSWAKLKKFSSAFAVKKWSTSPSPQSANTTSAGWETSHRVLNLAFTQNQLGTLLHADDALSYLPLQECLQRSFKAEVYTCPACRHDLGKNYSMAVNKSLQDILNQLFPGYNSGRWSWVLSAKVMWMPDVNCKGKFQ